MLFRMVASAPSRMGFILAGGKSSRMGTDKAFLDFDGETLLDRALGAMGAVCDRVAIVGDPAKFTKYASAETGSKSGLRYQRAVPDTFPECGPLGGIHAALTHSDAELNLILAVDMPFVSPQLLAFLFTAAEAGDAVITVPRSGKGLQPLCAVYRREFSAVAERALRAGKYKVDAAFSKVSIRIIEESELEEAGFSERSFFNVNTPQDIAAAEHRSP